MAVKLRFGFVDENDIVGSDCNGSAGISADVHDTSRSNVITVYNDSIHRSVKIPDFSRCYPSFGGIPIASCQQD